MIEQFTQAELDMIGSALRYYHDDRQKIARKMARRDPDWMSGTRFQDVLDEINRIARKVQGMKGATA